MFRTLYSVRLLSWILSRWNILSTSPAIQRDATNSDSPFTSTCRTCHRDLLILQISRISSNHVLIHIKTFYILCTSAVKRNCAKNSLFTPHLFSGVPEFVESKRHAIE